jgi:hypothetical protein
LKKESGSTFESLRVRSMMFLILVELPNYTVYLSLGSTDRLCLSIWKVNYKQL